MSRLSDYRRLIQELVRDNKSDQLQRVLTSRVINWLEKNPNADMSEVRRELERIFGANVNPYIDRSLEQFKTFHKDVNELYKSLGRELAFDSSELQAMRAVTQIRYGQFSAAQLRALQRDVARGLADNVGLDELRRTVKKAGGRVAFYGDTIAGTQYSAYGQAMKNEKANIAGVEKYEYVGNLRATSRAFCLKHIGKQYTADEIKRLDSDPDLGSAGIRPVAVYCGGWNCGHNWEPVL